MSITIRFVGGPADGRTVAIPDEHPPFRYYIPLPPSPAEFLAASLKPAPIRAAEYEPMSDRGWPSRADDGAYLYQHRPTPLTADDKRALEEKRRAARAAEEKRDDELDQTWREIRQARPSFPEDWRNL